MITFDEMWYFIETTTVTENVAVLIDPNTGKKIDPNEYIIRTNWEMRFDIPKLKYLWNQCYTFIIHGSTVTPAVRNLIEEVERDNNVHAQSHIYAGKVGSRSFSVHCDNPDNLIVQCIGKSRVTVYNEYGYVADVISSDSGLSIKEQKILEPGDNVYIPAKQYHLFEPLTDRLSISIPMVRL